ncbi:MAG: hypothetical protein HY647_05805 [Acidobacteria bacterium]|nr:hypothetical protein [Acidobacteriota bacterium]
MPKPEPQPIPHAKLEHDRAMAARWCTTALLLFLLVSAAAIALVLFREGQSKVLLIALISGVLLLALERLESKRMPQAMRSWRGWSGVVRPAIVISAVTFLIYLPTLTFTFSEMTLPTSTYSAQYRWGRLCDYSLQT